MVLSVSSATSESSVSLLELLSLSATFKRIIEWNKFAQEEKNNLVKRFIFRWISFNGLYSAVYSFIHSQEKADNAGDLDKIIFFCNKFGDSVGLLESVGDIIENDPELNKYIEVVKIHDRGNDWILRDYYKKSIELKKAIPNSLKAETAYMEVMKRLQILRKACLIFKKIGVGKNFTSNIANIL